jgi:hypothetical protein
VARADHSPGAEFSGRPSPGACSLLTGKRAPCFFLILNCRDILEMPVLQRFLAFLSAGSLFFSKNTLILAK